MAPAPALAGAWIAPEGGQEISTNVVGQRNGLTFFENPTYWEAPLERAPVAIVIAPWVEQSYETEEGWRAEATLAVKRPILRNDTGAMAVQAGLIWTSHPVGDCGEAGAELRWLGGRTFGPDGRGFINLEAAERVQQNGCGGERFDLTAGFRRANWLGMAQLFLDAPRGGEETLKAQITLVRFSESGLGLQIGVRTRLDDGPAEPAIVLGFWGRPGD